MSITHVVTIAALSGLISPVSPGEIGHPAPTKPGGASSALRDHEATPQELGCVCMCGSKSAMIFCPDESSCDCSCQDGTPIAKCSP
jgi:hypothetical protein